MEERQARWHLKAWWTEVVVQAPKVEAVWRESTSGSRGGESVGHGALPVRA
jgi:hypothetical protein